MKNAHHSLILLTLVVIALLPGCSSTPPPTAPATTRPVQYDPSDHKGVYTFNPDGTMTDASGNNGTWKLEGVPSTGAMQLTFTYEGAQRVAVMTSSTSSLGVVTITLTSWGSDFGSNGNTLVLKSILPK